MKLINILQEIQIKAGKKYMITSEALDWIDDEWEDIRYARGEDLADGITLARCITKDNKTIHQQAVVSFLNDKNNDGWWEGDYKSLIDFLINQGVIK